ncbi:hypothetical protein PIB30_031963 [Stylosanthes scabra]|uniref:RRM domain-containing protein n=1 Tax=Stylosanthes scabra TaxID=79078 RepID=A0ABU6SBR5_9FABA|nr:hypothetical protein [Stylosanthes scabra]
MRVAERGAVRHESGKHGEGFVYVESRNMGESGSGFAFGVRRFLSRGVSGNGRRTDPNGRSQTTRMVGSYTVFVDNLPTEITKRDLYKEFGKNGYITDVFASRKMRRKTKCPFAFIRYILYGGAMRAIGRLNASSWVEVKLYVTLSKVRREMKNNNMRQEKEAQPAAVQRRIQK